jgi:ArsR family transcriptional regulator
METKFDEIFKALGDPQRLKILEMLLHGETCGCTMIQKLPITQPTLSYHLNILTESGLATAYKDGVRKKHHINIDTLDQAIDYLTKLRHSSGPCQQ